MHHDRFRDVSFPSLFFFHSPSLILSMSTVYTGAAGRDPLRREDPLSPRTVVLLKEVECQPPRQGWIVNDTALRSVCAPNNVKNLIKAIQGRNDVECVTRKSTCRFTTLPRFDKSTLHMCTNLEN